MIVLIVWQLSVAAQTDDGTDLRTLGFWPASALAKLSESWITTAEQLVAIAATPDGARALAEHTRLPEAEFYDLLERTRCLLPAHKRELLSKPADTSSFGRGALKPPDDTDE